MSVFTPVSHEQLAGFLDGFDLGRLIEHRDIIGGTENSNFFVATERGEYVLTLIERGPEAQLSFLVDLLDCLHRAALPVPYAIRDRQQRALRQLNGRPALLQPRLFGKHVDVADASHCQAVGRVLAQLHGATDGSGLQRRSDRGLDWMVQQANRLRQRSDVHSQQLLMDMLPVLERLRSHRPALPEAILHGDLFRDNVLFEGHHLTGLIDFHNAFSGWALYDVAICVNDWCLAEQGGLDARRADALLAGYAAVRRFTPLEAELWPDILRLAALRFWLSRQLAAEQHAGQRGVLIKDPAHFRALLAHHRELTVGLPLAL